MSRIPLSVALYLSNNSNNSGVGVGLQILHTHTNLYLKIAGERDVRWLLNIRVRFDDCSRKTNIYGISWTGVVCKLAITECCYF